DRRARRDPRHGTVSALRAGSLRGVPAAARHLRGAARRQAGDRGRCAAADCQARRRGPRDRRGGRGVAVPGERQAGGERRSRAVGAGGGGGGGGPATGFPATAFEHVNPEMGTIARGWAVEQLGDVRGAVVWDLYGGIGDTAVELAERGAQVVSVDADEKAID